MDNAKKTLHKWQDKLDRNLQAYAGELDKMDAREVQYKGGHALRPLIENGIDEPTETPHVWNITSENIESEIDNSMPTGKVTPSRQQDNLLGKMIEAMLLDELDRLNAMPPVQHQDTGKVMLNVALPKGRLGDKVYNLLAGIGYGCPEDYNATRKLVVENPAAGIRYFLVKPSDVAIYVEHGAADVGIVGKDILTEASADVYELLDTGLGRCRMCVAAPNDYQDDPSRPVRVATKFVNIAKNYYASIGRDIDIIKLNGSIELAPILGLSDVIVDIVETGTTLWENGLKVVTEFLPISARFIANKASYQFKHREVDRMLEQLRETLQEAAK